MSATILHTGPEVAARAGRPVTLEVTAFASGTVLFSVGATGLHLTTHCDVAGARAFAAALIECADAIEAQKVAA